MSTVNRNSRAAQLRELFDSRVALAKLEVQHDIASSRRLGIVAGSGAVVAIVGISLLAITFAEYLAALTQTNPLWWQFAFGSVMLLAGASAIYVGWKAFRRDFSGLSETLEELREDQRWLGEMAAEIASSAGVRVPPPEDADAPSDE